MNPVMVPLAEYILGQRAKFVNDLVELHRDGVFYPAFVEHRRTLHGIPPEDVPVAMLQAHIQFQRELQAA